MAKLTNVESGVAYEVPTDTAYFKEERAWIAGGQRFTDETGDEYAFEAAISPPIYPQVSPIEFKLLFTSPERVAIKAARISDPVVDDFYDIVEDPRLTFVDMGLRSTQDAIGYMAAQGLIAAERVPVILSGAVV